MGLTFTTADTVATGDEIKGSQLKSLADAFNDRLRSGWLIQPIESSIIFFQPGARSEPARA